MQGCTRCVCSNRFVCSYLTQLYPRAIQHHKPCALKSLIPLIPLLSLLSFISSFASSHPSPRLFPFPPSFDTARVLSRPPPHHQYTRTQATQGRRAHEQYQRQSISSTALVNGPRLLLGIMQHAATHRNTLRHTATHCSTLQFHRQL